jgi:hypothetical protein
MGQGIVHFIDAMARESTMDGRKKNSGVSPCFLHLKIKKSLFG